jgi:hypothetical protein
LKRIGRVPIVQFFFSILSLFPGYLPVFVGKCDHHCHAIVFEIFFLFCFWLPGKLTLNFGAPYAMRDAIKFLYTGEVHVTMDRVKDLLEVADYLQIAEMTDICVRYLKGIHLTMDNCVQVCVYVFMRVRSQIYHA